MTVRVKFFATIKEKTGTSETLVDIADGTVGIIIKILSNRYGDEFRKEILLPDGSVRPRVRILLNGVFIDRYSDPLQYAVSDGDAIFLFPPILGG